MAKLVITVDRTAERALAERAQRLKPTGPPIRLTPLEQSVQFLRGVHSRATMVLPAFYLYHGAKTDGDPPCAIADYPGLVLKRSIEFSSISTISLSARKAFDHAATGLTGANFAKNSDEALTKVAEYWSKKSNRPVQEAFAALYLLRLIFRDCSKTEAILLNATAPLGRRIALLKQYANRSAAHLSLENYEFSTLDCVHVVAALTVIGEIIRSFDDPDSPATYFDTLDEASLSAARQLFPATPDLRLFGLMEIEVQSRLCWQFGVEGGRQMLLEQLPYAIGWF
jgi:hypothetical protein